MSDFRILKALVALQLFALTQLYAVTYTGTVTYNKTVVSSSSTSTVQTPAEGITVQLSGSSTVTGVTDASGQFSIDSTDTSVSVTAFSTGSGISVGESFSTSANSIQSIHSVSLGSLSSSSTALGTVNITDATIASAMNVHAQLFRGKTYITSLSAPLTPSVEINCVFPSSLGTQYRPTENYIIIQSTLTDPDGNDDDIILHEFGHWVAENFSTDHSFGGQHTVTSSNDLRLSWSEGLAHYISSAIRNNSQHLDYSTFGTSNFDINSLGSSRGSDVELAVANFLWQVHQTYGSNTVFPTLTSFRSLPSSISSDNISLDTFYDMWRTNSSTNTLSLDTFVTNTGTSYYLDTVANNTNLSPSTISTPDSFIYTDASFFDDRDEDYFSFTGLAGTNYHIETGNIKNGALTSLKVYKGAAASGSPIASNDQRSASYNNSSYIFLEVTETATYSIAVSRFNSTSQNYGPGSLDGYSSTVGRYGTYALAMTKATGSADPNKAHHPSLSLASTPVSSNNNTATGSVNPFVVPGSTSINPNNGVTSSSSGGGGCMLRRQ